MSVRGDRRLRRGFPLAMIVAAAIASLLTPGVGHAQREEVKRDDAKRQLEVGRRTLDEAQRRAQGIQSDVQALNAEQARINEQLIETGRLAQASEARLTQIEHRLGELDAQEKLLRGSLVARHDRIAKLVSGLQRMGRNPPPVIITRREDALQMVRSAMLLARAFPELKTQADALARQLDDLTRVVTDARTEGERLKAESTRLTEARTRLAALVENKRRSLGERQKELEDVRRSATEIAKSVTELGDLIAKLDKTVSERTALGEYDRELKARAEADARQQQVAAAAPTAPSPSPSPAAALPSAPDGMRPAAKAPGPSEATQGGAAGQPAQGPRVALEPQAGAASNAGRMKPAIPFHLAKAQLPMPAQGRRVMGFGEKNQFGRPSRGLVIETRHGAAVTSPADGWVVYAGEFRSYGQVLIINAGGGYHILLANLARTDVEVGRFILSGEPVGAMSSNTGANMGAKEAEAAPVLYVEFRNKDGQSIDPSPWWADPGRRLQG